MQRKIWLSVLVAALLLGSGPAAYADVYTIVVGAGVGTKITTTPYTINNPGFYYLGRNLTYNGGTTGAGITINASNVTLDLMGFTLSAGTYMVGVGIRIMTTAGNVEVRNGTVRDFWDGITQASSDSNICISNVRAINNYSSGFSLVANNPIVRDCTAHQNDSGFRLQGGKISGCVATQNRGFGFYLESEGGGGSMIDNVANKNDIGFYVLHDPYILWDRNSASGNNSNFSVPMPVSHAVWGLNLGR